MQKNIIGLKKLKIKTIKKKEKKKVEEERKEKKKENSIELQKPNVEADVCNSNIKCD